MTTLVPISDISESGWTANPSGDLFAAIDETIDALDTDDFIAATIAPSSDELFQVGLAPLSALPSTVRVKIVANSSFGSARAAQLRLRDHVGHVVADGEMEEAFAIGGFGVSIANLEIDPDALGSGGFDWTSLSLIVSVQNPDIFTNDVVVYAVEVVVDGESGPGPGGQRARNAAVLQQFLGV